jgi:hypothetical protein
VLESSGRSLPVLVPLLVGAWTNSVSLAGEIAVCPTPFSATWEQGACLSLAQTSDSLAHSRSYDIDAVAAGLRRPPAELAGMIPSSLRPRSLPAVPKSILMAALGFLCVSLVHDRRIWLTVAARLLPIGHNRPNLIPGLPSYLRGRRHHGHVTLSGLAGLFRERVPLCVCVHPVRRGNVSDKEPAGACAAIVYPQSASDRLVPCAMANADPVWFVSPQLTFTQLARGPPSWTWRT